MIVLIDGRSGAGKTTFANLLGGYLGAPVVHLEDFYPGWGGLEEASRMVARDVFDRDNPGWWRWDWVRNRRADWRPLALGDSCDLVIEGCGAVSHEALKAAEGWGIGAVVSVYIDADPGFRRARALTRDPDFAPWWRMWARQEEEHAARMPAPDLRADGESLDAAALIEDITRKGRSMNNQVIRIAAVVIRNGAGEILSVRKRGTTAFMLPGGKLELGETGLEAAVREIAEELHLALDPAELSGVGTMSAPAANEPGFEVVCDVFEWQGTVERIGVFEEIEEARWFAADSRTDELAPLSRDVVFPALVSRKRK